jgi:hypothetical protein
VHDYFCCVALLCGFCCLRNCLGKWVQFLLFFSCADHGSGCGSCVPSNLAVRLTNCPHGGAPLPVLMLSCLCCFPACAAPGPQLAAPRGLLVFRRHAEQGQTPPAAPSSAAGACAGTGARATHAERRAASLFKGDRPPWPVLLRRGWLAGAAARHGFAPAAAAGTRGECPASL